MSNLSPDLPPNAIRTRPAMQNYGLTAAEEGLLDWSWVEDQVRKSRNYWIATTRPDGRPHAAPVWGVWVDGVLYFGTDPGSRKARNLAQNPEAVVHLESGDDCVIFEGTIAFLKDAPVDLLKRISVDYGAKYVTYQPDFTAPDASPLLWLKPRTVLAWQEHDFPNTATRWVFK